MANEKPEVSANGDEDVERWALVGVAFAVSLAMLTVPLAFSGYAALQGGRTDGSPALLVMWLVYWCLVPFPLIFSVGSIYGLFKLLFLNPSKHSPSVPIQLVFCAVFLFGAYRIGH